MRAVSISICMSRGITGACRIGTGEVEKEVVRGVVWGSEEEGLLPILREDRDGLYI